MLECILLVALAQIAGCTIPLDCGDLDYPTYGGAWQRTRRDSGRVGSIFDPAGARVASLSPREDPERDEAGRSIRDSILSVPGQRSDASGTLPEPMPDEPSPSDRLDPERLRDLQLDDIQIEPGPPAPPELN